MPETQHRTTLALFGEASNFHYTGVRAELSVPGELDQGPAVLAAVAALGVVDSSFAAAHGPSGRVAVDAAPDAVPVLRLAVETPAGVRLTVFLRLDPAKLEHQIASVEYETTTVK